MGFRDWFSRNKAPPRDPLQAYDARLDALAERAALLRKSAATLLAVRRDLDRKLLALQERTAQAQAQLERARDDLEVRAVLDADLQRLGRDGEALTLQRARVDQDAVALTAAVGTVEQERETLSAHPDVRARHVLGRGPDLDRRSSGARRYQRGHWQRIRITS